MSQTMLAHRVVRGPEEWLVLLRDRVPAYISWDQYEANLARLKANRAVASEIGAPRHGPSLLSGLLVCAKCGCRMTVRYNSHDAHHSYACTRQLTDYGGDVCQSLAGAALDRFVRERALEALAPASLELSLEATKNLERERTELARLWEQRLERSSYEVDRAARQYRQVEPENRLVARQLEKEWDEKLGEHKKLEEDHRRFEQKQPRVLTDTERDAVRKLAAHIRNLSTSLRHLQTEFTEVSVRRWFGSWSVRCAGSSVAARVG
jgi:hypothetical protein